MYHTNGMVLARLVEYDQGSGTRYHTGTGGGGLRRGQSGEVRRPRQLHPVYPGDKAARDWFDALTAPEPGEQVSAQPGRPPVEPACGLVCHTYVHVYVRTHVPRPTIAIVVSGVVCSMLYMVLEYTCTHYGNSS